MVLLWWESVGGAFIIRGPFARLIIAWQITYSSEKYSVVCGKIFREKNSPSTSPCSFKKWSATLLPRVTLLSTLKALVYDLRQRQIMHVFMHYLFVCLAGTRITLPTCLCASLCTHSWKMCLITSLVAKKNPHNTISLSVEVDSLWSYLQWYFSQTIHVWYVYHSSKAC